MRVAVVMSTYQGERYVDEQVASILAQLPPDGWLIVRDDGSRDGTVARVEALAAADPRIRLLRGENLGFARSFFALLASVPPEAELAMLADQDDVWLPDKIERAARALQGRAGPTLYFSRLWLVDESLRRFGVTLGWPRGPSFENALAENIVTGCTIALNPAAVQLVLRLGDASRIHFHDWWIYLVVSAFGTVVADPEPSVNYRQHGGNVVGRGSGWRRYLVNLQFIRRSSWVHIMYNQLENFRAAHGANLSPAQRTLMDRYFDPRNAASVLRLLLVPRRHRQLLADEFLLRGLVLWDVLSGRGLLPKEKRAP
ncbi:glycosyltransferase family 2 protein [Caenimonas sedimenti]|nr:glycosyltransferase family 2 protein [Caenimonas sedimenti]